jgi:hypothetical protein
VTFLKAHPVFSAFLILFVVFAAIVAWDYRPHPKTLEVKQAESALKYAKHKEIEATAKLASAEQELEHTHRMVVSTDAPLKRDSVVIDQQTKIVALEADTASKAIVIITQRALLAVKDEKFATLDKLNASIKASLPSTGQKLRHDGKVVGFTLAAVGVAKFLLSATGH